MDIFALHHNATTALLNDWQFFFRLKDSPFKQNQHPRVQEAQFLFKELMT